jgi:hypothetical protein
MAFTVLNDAPKMVWMPVASGTTLYVGQLVKSVNGGASQLVAATGIEDDGKKLLTEGMDFSTTALNNSLFGVVVGTNNKTPVFDTTYNTERIAYSIPYAATVGNETYAGSEGPWARGDNIAMVKVAILTPNTVLRGNLFASTSNVGTALTVSTVTASSSGIGFDSAASGSTGRPESGCVYFRSGVATGQYRVLNVNESTTMVCSQHLTLATSGTSIVGDTFVKANIRPVGPSLMQTGTLGMWVNPSVNTSANGFGIHVHKMDLSVAGQEHIDFSFTPSAFNLVGGSAT